MRDLHGPIAQLGERRVRNAEVVSSILIRSTNLFKQIKGQRKLTLFCVHTLTPFLVH